MKPYTKRRAKLILIGLGFFLATILFVPSPLCFFPGLCPGGFQMFGVYVNPLGFLSIFFVGTWAMGIIFGLGLAGWSLLKGEPLKSKYCSVCGRETDQFESKRKYKEAFKPRTSEDWKEYKANIISQEYTCNECGGKTLELPVGDSENAEK
jgi:hypothetical protein